MIVELPNRCYQWLESFVELIFGPLDAAVVVARKLELVSSSGLITLCQIVCLLVFF